MAGTDDLTPVLEAVRRTLGHAYHPLGGGGVVGGFSHQTLVLERADGHRVVVRIPPVEGPYPPYDVVAEGHLLARLAGVVPVPEVLAVEDGQVGGARPFLVMEWVDGTVELPGRGAGAPGAGEDGRARADAVMAALATVHAVDWQGLGVAEVLGVDGDVPLGRRCLERWGGVLAELRVHAPPAAWYGRAWLRDTVPAGTAPALVHGDFRLGNLLWDAGGRAVVLDWEQATVGDPLFDLAWILMGAVSDDDRALGLVTKREAIRLYEEHRGVTVDRDQLGWWEVLVTWIRLCMEARSFDFEAAQAVPDLRCTLWQFGSLRTGRDLLALIDRRCQEGRRVRQPR